MDTKTHLALYGSVKIPRAWCEGCAGFALVIAGQLACCRRALEVGEVLKVKRMCHDDHQLPPPRLRRLILRLQRDRCFYCDRPFGLRLWEGPRRFKLEVYWDRMVPFSYSRDNVTRNIVAACSVCILLKRGFTFQTVEEASVFLETKWQEKGYRFRPPEDLPSVPAAVPSRT